MVLKLETPGQRAKLVHPNIPELVIEVERPSMRDVVAWEEVIAKFKKPDVALMNPNTGKPVRDAYGRAQAQPVKPEVPFEATLDTMAPFIKNVEGFDEPFSPEPKTVKKFLYAFLEPRFTFMEEVEVPVLDDEGKPTGEKRTEKEKRNFYHHIIAKLFDPATYGEDPLGSSSENSASESSD